jgi:hypothetical protein
MKNGDTRRGPRSFNVMAVSAMPSMPPMPDPIMTPVEICSAWEAGFQPLSSIAWRAAHIA